MKKMILLGALICASQLLWGMEKSHSLTLSSNVIIRVMTPPGEPADKLREAMGKAGAGVFGNYAFCSFSHKGTGRWVGLEGAKPFIGKVGTLESAEEEVIQVQCPIKILDKVITAIKGAHPYDEPGIDIIPLYAVPQ